MNSVASYYKYVLIALLFILQTTNVMGAQKADAVLVIKSEKRLYLMREGEPFASFRVSFGSNPRGHKQEQKDRKEARKRGADPGGDIMIHGQKNGYGRLSFLVQRFNWTNGCIALSDRDIDTVWNAVKPGTPIEIKP
jgi:murein L,D-transpeptidase YafK